MSWTCAQLDALRDDYLDGRLPAADLRAADAHARACPTCAEHYEARLPIAWLPAPGPDHTGPPRASAGGRALAAPAPPLEGPTPSSRGSRPPPSEESFWAVF